MGRTMSKRTVRLVFILAVTLGGMDSVSAQQWQTLENEPSRADLFGQFIVPKNRPEGFALLGPFVFPTDTTIDKTTNASRTDVIFGIDVSHYESADIRFDMMRDQNVRFVYAKATQGVGFKDGRFADFWAALGALTPEKKVLRGAYHFLSSSDDPVAQADSFLKLLDENGGLKPGDLPRCLIWSGILRQRTAPIAGRHTPPTPFWMRCWLGWRA
jgi:lysozyme